MLLLLLSLLLLSNRTRSTYNMKNRLKKLKLTQIVTHTMN